MARREKLVLGSSLLDFWWLLSDFKGLCLQHATEECMQKSPNTNWKNWWEWSQNRPRTCLKSISEEVWGPLGSHPCDEVTPRHHFWRFRLHFGTPFGGQSGLILGINFWCFFDTASGWRFHRFGVHLGPFWDSFFGTLLEAVSATLHKTWDVRKH